MNYKLPKNILLASILVYSILSIVTARQIEVINDRNQKSNLLNYSDYIKSLGKNVESVARTRAEYPNFTKNPIDNYSYLVEVDEDILINRLLNDTEIPINDSFDENFRAFTHSMKNFANPSLFFLYFLYSVLMLLILLIFINSCLCLFYFLLDDNSKLAKNIKYQIQDYGRKILLEEQINDRETIRERLKKQNKSHEEIETKITILTLTMLRGYLICKLQNIWLDRNKIE